MISCVFNFLLSLQLERCNSTHAEIFYYEGNVLQSNKFIFSLSFHSGVKNIKTINWILRLKSFIIGEAMLNYFDLLIHCRLCRERRERRELFCLANETFVYNIFGSLQKIAPIVL